MIQGMSVLLVEVFIIVATKILVLNGQNSAIIPLADKVAARGKEMDPVLAVVAEWSLDT